jgi:hypothetical protein
MRSYLAIESLDEAEFKTKKVDLSESRDATRSDEADIQRIENILDLRRGTLAHDNFYVSKSECSCGKIITFYDFVFTALVEQWHDPSFIAHTLVGNKLILNQPRRLRCSICGTRSRYIYQEYERDGYGCCLEIGKPETT